MRQDMIPLLMPESETRFGAVETAAEGRKFAAFLQAHRGEYAGVILCCPISAMKTARSPLWQTAARRS